MFSCSALTTGTSAEGFELGITDYIDGLSCVTLRRETSNTLGLMAVALRNVARVLPEAGAKLKGPFDRRVANARRPLKHHRGCGWGRHHHAG